ncbi:MAG: hypothetical protein WCX91_03945 [Candidatus Omnitrophota bacterium]|jgi:hypothetical protein
MPDPSRQKLSAEEQLRLCSILSIGHNACVAADLLKEQTGIEISPQNIYQNYLKDKHWKKIIERMAREAERRVLKHPLAKKVNRLNLLKQAADECLSWRLDKINYDKDGNELSRIEKRNVGIMPQIIREARAEIEGDKSIILDQSTHTHFFIPVKLDAKAELEKLTDGSRKV